ncbi:MAG TPA: SIMPL domain-containing protein [Mycobacteriales bacterium]|nr:SIMPL domain-containing protein [Mycobacteriales bacterium]
MPDPGARHGVTVTATGTASGAPDVLRLRLAAESQARDVSGALDGASRAMAAMVARLRAAGVAESDLRTSGASLWSRTDDAGRITWQVAVQRLTATLRDLAAAGALVPEVVQVGGPAARLDGLEFAVDDDAALVRAARDDAWRRAGEVAAQHAERAGQALGPVLRVVEATAGGGVMRPMALAARARDAMPTQGGDQEVSVTIEVEWAFSA